MCVCILPVKKQFTYLSCTQPRSSYRTQPNKSQQGENKEEAMGMCGARVAGHSFCLWDTGGCCLSCQSLPCLAWAPGGYVSTSLVEHGKQFQPKGRGDECFKQFLKNSTCLFKLCPSSAPVWFLLSGQLSSVVSSGPMKNRHMERKYSSGRRTRLFSDKKKKARKKLLSWNMFATNSSSTTS